VVIVKPETFLKWHHAAFSRGMLREDCFQLPDFFAEPLALRKCFF
jgi:hypothetical protein